MSFPFWGMSTVMGRALLASPALTRNLMVVHSGTVSPLAGLCQTMVPPGLSLSTTSTSAASQVSL